MCASPLASRSPILLSNSPHGPILFCESSSQRYAYIPTAKMWTELRKEGFQHLMVTQTRALNKDSRDFIKYMTELRHASQINARVEANEIILRNLFVAATANVER
ncbi:hypothetical protein F4826_001485 [Rahnella inusitata]|nr:hypothetical protein [Rahnella inusitata]